MNEEVIADRIWTRWGLALSRPREAVARGCDPRHPGRASSDLLTLLVVVVVVTQACPLVGAGWLALRVDLGLGVRAALDVFSLALALPLCVVAITAAIAWLAAGRARALGRAFDAACVGMVPFACVQLVATVIAHAVGVELPLVVSWALTIGALAWTVIILVLAVGELRGGAQDRTQGDRQTRARWLVPVVAVVGLVSQAVWIVGDLQSLRPIGSGEQAPELALPKITTGGALGERVSLAGLHGRPVVIDFWATWCNPCLRALPELDTFAKRHPEVTVLAVALDEPADARILFDQRGYGLTLVLDDGATSKRFGVVTVPHTLIVDSAGVVQRVADGGLNLDAELANIH